MTSGHESLNRRVRELEESARRYELAVAGSDAGLFDWDIATNVLFTSDRMQQLLGYAPDEISITMDWFWERLHPEDSQVVRVALEKHLADRAPYVIDYRMRTKSGEYRWFHARGQALWDESGKAVRMSGSLTDITRRKEAEQALRDSRGRLMRAQRVARMGFLDWDLKTNEIEWSEAVYDLYGIERGTPVTLEQTVGLVHPDDLEFVNENLNMALEGVRDYDIDHRMVRPDGKVIWVHARADLERDAEGRPATLIGSVVDITEPKLAEEELSKSEARFRNLMERSPLGIAIYTPEGRINEVNTAFMRAWGLDELADEASARLMAEYNMLTDPQLEELGVMPLVEKGFAGERIVFPPIEYSGRRTAEDLGLEDMELRTIWIETHLYSIKDEHGAVAHVVNINMDITERKLAEEELSKSEERFRHLMEQSPLAIEILSPEGQIVEANGAWVRLWGLKDEAEKLAVMAAYNMLTDEQVKDLGIMPLVERAFAGEQVVLPPIEYSAPQTGEAIGLGGVGSKTPWIQCHLYPVKDENGDVAYVVNTYMDITELKHAERETREQRDALARVERATSMGQLTGSIAHELNQPLTGILSSAQAGEILIKKGQLDSDALTEIMAAIAADAKRAGEVLHNLRDLYREQKGEFAPVDITQVVEEVVRLLHSELVFENVELTTEYAPSLPRVDGNRIQLEQVLVNLMMNGIQAMGGIAGDGRRLYIGAEFDANEVTVWVEDRGSGIDPDTLDHIFEPLATWKPGGTGMGLAVSNSIVEAHGGRMWAENLPEGGARVGFALPVSNAGGPT